MTTTDGALAYTSRARPAQVSAWSATLTIAWRALLKIKHVPFQLFDVTITPIMFTLLFTYMFGGALAGSPGAYIQFLLPGILVQTIVFITVYTGVGLNTDIQKGLYDRFRSLPMWQPAPIVGALAGDLLRYTVAAAIVMIVGVVLGFRPAGGVTGVLVAYGLVVIFSLALSWVWIICAMKVQTPESAMTASFLLLFPLTFASNIFVEIATMPTWLQLVVSHNPVSHLTSSARGWMHGAPVYTDDLWVLGWSAVLTLVTAPIALRMYHQER